MRQVNFYMGVLFISIILNQVHTYTLEDSFGQLQS